MPHNFESLLDLESAKFLMSEYDKLCYLQQKMNRRWICSDVWMDILPHFDRPQLGLKLAILSPRFELLVDKHFDGKRELTILKTITIRKDDVITGAAELSVLNDYANSESFPWPDRPLPNKIHFKHLQIDYIDHSVIAFLRSNQQIWDKGTNLSLIFSSAQDVQPTWGVFVREIWPIFAQNIRHLSFYGDGILLDNLRRLISPTILTDFNINSIYSGRLLPEPICDDGPNAIPTAGQMLSKWLHTPTKDGQPKRLLCFLKPPNIEWANTLKTKFLKATTSVHYKIQFIVYRPSTQIVPFELANERTKEKLTLIKTSEQSEYDKCERWIMKRCKNGETTAAVKWENYVNSDANLNNVKFDFWDGSNYIGPLSPPVEKEDEEADQSNGN